DRLAPLEERALGARRVEALDVVEDRQGARGVVQLVDLAADGREALRIGRGARVLAEIEEPANDAALTDEACLGGVEVRIEGLSPPQRAVHEEECAHDFLNTPASRV